MVILFVLLVAFGLLMVLKPGIVWQLTESWKSDDAAEPSELYLFATRLGGILCTLAGIGGVIAKFV